MRYMTTSLILLLLPLLASAQTDWLPTTAGSYRWAPDAVDPVNRWNGDYPNGVTAYARITPNSSAYQIINVYQAITLNKLEVGTGNSSGRIDIYNQGGGTGLTFWHDQISQAPTLTMTAGSGNVILYGTALAADLSITQNSTSGTLFMATMNGNNFAYNLYGAGNVAWDIGSNIGAINQNGTGRLQLVAANGPPSGGGAVTVNSGTIEMNVSRSFVNGPGWAGYFQTGRQFTVESAGTLLFNGNWLTGDGFQNIYTVNGGRIGGTGDFNYINRLNMTGGRR
jgi:hypothetical protein